MENLKLSLIVPVYNVEKYLRKCVDSLIHQDFRDYEIILVDDGSTDGSGELCDEIAQANDGMSRADALNEPLALNDGKPLIRVIHQKNRGLSAARNAGIKVAKGEYVCFVDSDDFWEENVLGGLMTQVEREQLDVLRYNFQNVRLVESKYEMFEPFRAAKRDVDYSEEVTDGETFLNERLGPMCYAVMFIIKRSLVYNDGMSRDKSLNEPLSLNDACLFKEGIYFEDTEWTPRMLLRAKRVASTPMMVYNYFWRVGSISLAVAQEKLRKTVEDKIGLIRGFKEQQKLVKNPMWFEWMTSFTAMTILDILTDFSSKERRAYVRELQSLDIFPLMTKKEKIQSHKIKVQMANISPLLYCKIMHMVKSVRCKVCESFG